MSDDRNDGWNHRSEMLDHTDPALRAVSRGVNERATGPTMTQQEVLAFVDDVEPDEGDDDPEEGTTEKRSNREKLLAGETV
jgi:hypothetical protein